MDLDDIKQLSNEDKARYMMLERVFSADGWKLIEEWAKQGKEAAEHRLLNANSWEEYRVMTGARLVYDRVLNLREATEQEFLQQAQAKRLADQQDDELAHE